MKNYLCAPEKKYFLFTILFLLVNISSLSAQNLSFEKFSIGANLSANSNIETLHDYWDPGNLYEVNLRTPIQFGNMQVGLSYIPFKSKNSEQPDFKGMFFYLQWDKEIFTVKDFEINAGIMFGLCRMVFDKTEMYKSKDELQEHEVSAGFVSSINYNITQNVGLNLTANYNSILTRKKINLAFIGAGFYYTFDTPQWLKDFLE